MRRSFVLIPVAVLLLVQSCCCCTMMGGPQPPYPITPSDEAIQQLEERLNGLSPGPDGAFTITVTDEEITSLVASRIDQLEQQGQTVPISSPQVYFRNGQIEVYAVLELPGSLTLPCMLALTVAVEDGVPVVTVQEVVAGPLPVPAALVQQVMETINQQIAEGFAAEGTDFAVVNVQIGEGEMTVTTQMSPR